jgi:outer membrane protein TolC
MTRLFVFWLLITLFFNVHSVNSSVLISLPEYQKQVLTQNQTYKAGELQVEAFSQRMSEASIDFIPSLVGGVNYLNNKAVQTSPLFLGTDTYSESANLGVQTKLRTGTLLNFGYNLSYNSIYGASPQFVLPSQTSFYVASPTLTLTQPLWRDFGAALSKANEEVIFADYQTRTLQQRFQNQQILFNTQTAYWRLALNRELVKYDKEAIERAQKNYKLTSRRVSMNVADRSDSLQTLTALKTRQLLLQNDMEALRQASSAFNSLRNVAGDEVPEEISNLDKGSQESLVQQIENKSERLDVSASLQAAKRDKASAKVSLEKFKPDVSVFGSVQFNGRAADANSAMGESWNADNPTYGAGLKLSVPLDRTLINHVTQGYNASSLASDMLSRRAQFDLNQDWNDLKKRLKDSVVRLDMARELEKLQDEKLRHEKERLGSGRTTSFQVLQFEDNYFDAQASRLRVQNEIVSIYAQAVLYNGGSF